MLSIRASSLPSVQKCERRFGFQWLLEHDLADGFGFEPREIKNNVGSVVGNGAHEAVSYMWTHYQEHGTWDQLKVAVSWSDQYIADRSQHGLTYDANTKSAKDAVIAAQKIIKEYHSSITPNFAPLLVEQPLACRFDNPMNGEEYELTGTVDQYFKDAELRDLKSSVSLGCYYAQQGGYVDLLGANGHNVKELIIDHVPRTKSGKVQQPHREVHLDKIMAVQHSRSVHGRAQFAIAQFVETGEPTSFIANPSCDLCSKKFCPAYDTDFCRIGAAVNG